jgi:hypothetical protein
MNKVLDQFKTSELIYLVVGTLFLINAAVLYSGGGYSLLITAKIVYVIGFVFLLLNK